MNPPPDPAEEFVFLLARHERFLGAYVMTLVPNPQDADDILQEAKIIMWRNFSQFERGSNFGAWSRKVAFHQVLAFRKRRKRDRLDFSDAFLETVAAEMDSCSEHLEKRTLAMLSCISKLPPPHRETLHLRYQEGLGLEEMADRLQKTSGALYRLLSRIRHVLHECVTQSLQNAEDEPAI